QNRPFRPDGRRQPPGPGFGTALLGRLSGDKGMALDGAWAVVVDCGLGTGRGGHAMSARLGLAVVLLALAGCGVFHDGRSYTSKDSWHTPPPDSEFTPLDRARFAQVAAAHQEEAQEALADVPAKRLTAEEAARLVGDPLPEGKEYVLLRAV